MTDRISDQFHSAGAVRTNRTRRTARRTSPDHTYYLVICQHRDGPFAPERDAASMRSRKVTVADIAGDQFGFVVDRVLEFNPVEGWSRDVSEDIALEIVAAEDYPQDITGKARDFIESACGCGTVIPMQG